MSVLTNGLFQRCQRTAGRLLHTLIVIQHPPKEALQKHVREFEGSM